MRPSELGTKIGAAIVVVAFIVAWMLRYEAISCPNPFEFCGQDAKGNVAFCESCHRNRFTNAWCMVQAECW
jgi:hypothetical protein